MMDIHKAIGRLPRPKRGFVLPYHKYTGPYNPLHEQLDENDEPIAGQEPYNAVDAISMRHDICYRDNNTKEGKLNCDDEMLKELDELEPKGIREKSLLTHSFIKYKREEFEVLKAEIKALEEEAGLTAEVTPLQRGSKQ